MRAGHAERPGRRSRLRGNRQGNWVSLWPVRDVLARRFMTALYDHLSLTAAFTVIGWAGVPVVGTPDLEDPDFEA